MCVLLFEVMSGIGEHTFFFFFLTLHFKFLVTGREFFLSVEKAVVKAQMFFFFLYFNFLVRKG